VVAPVAADIVLGPANRVETPLLEVLYGAVLDPSLPRSVLFAPHIPVMGIFQIGFVGMVSLVLASARTVAQKSLILCSIRAIPFCGITGSTPMVTRVDDEVNFDWEQGQIPVSQNQTTFSAKWNGNLFAHISLHLRRVPSRQSVPRYLCRHSRI